MILPSIVGIRGSWPIVQAVACADGGLSLGYWKGGFWHITGVDKHMRDSLNKRLLSHVESIEELS